jgi:hypothetical protein
VNVGHNRLVQAGKKDVTLCIWYCPALTKTLYLPNAFMFFILPRGASTLS